MSVVVRAYGWMLILGRQGFVGETLAALSLPRAGLLHTETAVLLALTESFLPFMILALAASLDRIDPDLLAAARGLGASSARTFFAVVVPLALPGFVAGASFVLVGSLSAYAIPALLGGSAARTFVMEIYELVTISFDWPTRGRRLPGAAPLRFGAARRSGAGEPPPVGAQLRDLAIRDDAHCAGSVGGRRLRGAPPGAARRDRLFGKPGGGARDPTVRHELSLVRGPGRPAPARFPGSSRACCWERSRRARRSPPGSRRHSRSRGVRSRAARPCSPFSSPR